MSCRDTAGHFGFMDLEGFEPLTSRMRTERSPSHIAFVHTSCTARKEKSTYIRPYKMFCHPNDLSRSQVWSPSRGFSTFLARKYGLQAADFRDDAVWGVIWLADK